VNAFDDRLRNAQSKITPLAARIRFTNHKHTNFTLEKLTDFIRAQVPHFGDFRNGIMPLDVHRGLDLGWYGHFALVTPAGSRSKLIDTALEPIPGLGELYVYDTTLRIGAKLNLFPDKVYLHAGTRLRERALGLRTAATLKMFELPSFEAA